MSHVAEVCLVIRDLDALAIAAKRLGGEFMQGQTTHAWWSVWVGDWRGAGSAVAAGRDPATFGTCLHAIRLQGRPGKNGPAGPWEIGIVAAADGQGFKLCFDNFDSAGRELEQRFGQNLSRLSEEYGAEVALRQLARAGFRTQRIDGPLQMAR